MTWLWGLDTALDYYKSLDKYSVSHLVSHLPYNILTESH